MGPVKGSDFRAEKGMVREGFPFQFKSPKRGRIGRPFRVILGIFWIHFGSRLQRRTHCRMHGKMHGKMQSRLHIRMHNGTQNRM